MKNIFNEIKSFIIQLKEDDRLPNRDKKIILGMLILIISPIDFIPDWIPLWGLCDDLLLLALLFDYFFNILDQSILLSHYPYGLKSFNQIQRIGKFIGGFSPNFIGDFLWQYKKDIY
jgi:hypothetical protein